MTKFSDLKLDPRVLQAVTDAGYETPTPIQAGAIPPALEGRDVLGIAQTGTGKTAGFVLPMITLLGRGRARARMPRSLVLAPTRELAAQVAENFDKYAKNTKLTKALLIGGVSFGDQDKLIDRGVDVLIATPGRLLDHFERGKLLLTGVQIMVVDEADRMLDMGFIPDIERIFNLTPFTRQTLFFSATMAPEIERITNTFLHTPARIEVARQATASETIEQRLLAIQPPRKDQTAKAKREVLRAVILAEGDACTNAILFCNRKTEVDILAKSLKTYGFDAAPIHGDLDQSQRTRTLDGFRDGTLRFLVASDVAARGLDIPAVSHVFNFDVPSHAEDYVHRIGRTGRAGRKGVAVTIMTPGDQKYLDAIEALVKMPIPRTPLPEGFALSEAAHQPAKVYDDKRGTRPKSDRDRKPRHRGDKPLHDQEAGMQPLMGVEPIEASAAAPEAPARSTPKPDRREDRPREDRPRAERPREDRPREDRPRTEHVRAERAPDDRTREDRPRDDRRRDDRRDDRRPERSDTHIVGMGDHMPDFLTRPVPKVSSGEA
jgi:superfamily II DNA/RNA helicase